MRDYDRNERYESEDLDDYEEDGEEQEDYEEERENPKPTKEELKYLEIRQKLKEVARKRMKKENGVSFGNSQEKKKKLPNDNFGSFFGISQPVIAQRVIEESKSLLENQHLAARISHSSNGSRKTTSSANSERRPDVRHHSPKVNHETQTKLKAQKLKDNRDYSFLLSEDSELPAPRKEPSSRNISTPNSDARSAQVQSKSRQPASNYTKPYSNGRDERKSVPANRQTQTKAAYHQAASGSRRPNMTSVDSRKQYGSSSGNGPGRPMGPKGLPSRMPASTKATGSNKFSSLAVDKKPSLVGSKRPVADMKKTAVSKLHSSVQKYHCEQRREVQESEKAKLNSKMSVTSSKPQTKVPPKQIQPRAPMQVDRPKNRPARPYFDDEEEEDASALIRKMFRYDPRKYSGMDEDDSDMEANFDDILREEKRSAKIAKEEDERELRLIEEEERQERLRAKRRKLSQR